MQKRWIPIILLPIPALIVGAIVMYNNGIDFIIYGQNVILYLVLSALLLLFGERTMRMRDPCVTVFSLFLASLTLLTFIDTGLQNVHRWITIGGFRLYISSIILPSVIIGLGYLLQKGKTILPVSAFSAILLILTLQPDASQLSAFAISMIFLIWIYAKVRLIKIGTTLMATGVFIYSWLFIDDLGAVPHVEDILLLALDMGVVWFLLGILSLVMLLLPFLLFNKKSILAKSIGIYYLVIMLSTVFGNFPVPMMGFGVSPVIGYFLVLFLLFREDSLYDMKGDNHALPPQF